MTATSHAITGAAIAMVVKEPLFALPLAFFSHFVCDIIPHVGVKNKRLANYQYLIDLSLLIVFLIVLVLLNAPVIAFACVIAACLPDVVWFYRYIIKEKIQHTKPGSMNFFTRFHNNIQWSETLRYGLGIEIVYSSLLLTLISSKL